VGSQAGDVLGEPREVDDLADEARRVVLDGVPRPRALLFTREAAVVEGPPRSGAECVQVVDDNRDLGRDVVPPIPLVCDGQHLGTAQLVGHASMVRPKKRTDQAKQPFPGKDRGLP
jgi:hypothetical protein